MKCLKCTKEKDETEFKAKNNRVVKQCSACREMCKKWRAKNKERVKTYNKFTIEKTKKGKIKVIYAKLKDDEKWIKYKNQRQAALQLGVQASNINKVIKGKLLQTGGYEFKIVEEDYEKKINNWETIKKENGITDNVKGGPSQHRVLHETVNEIVGKNCCTCKEWKPLTNYNKSKTHWDKLRNECKECLVAYRKQNRKQIQKTMTKYERERKKKDPVFKLAKTMRSRLLSALTRKNAKKNCRTMDLIGASPSFVMGYLEAKFTEGMTWENHGTWHIDHIKPCCSFDLTSEEEQIKCFHFSNLQPLWAEDNLKKGGKF
jgi:predicted XRE-type DNA-binding protein